MSDTTTIRPPREYTIHVCDEGAHDHETITIPEGTKAEQDAAAWEATREYAREWLRNGWDATDQTIEVEASYWWEDAEYDLRDQYEKVIETIEPEEPECSHDDGHDWQSPYEVVGGLRENPGVWGKGGGVIIIEVCMHCGCARTTDTWADDGHGGIMSGDAVSYEVGRYADEVEAMRAVAE